MLCAFYDRSKLQLSKVQRSKRQSCQYAGTSVDKSEVGSPAVCMYAVCVCIRIRSQAYDWVHMHVRVHHLAVYESWQQRLLQPNAKQVTCIHVF